MSLNTNKKIAVIGLLLGGSFSAQADYVYGLGAGSYEESYGLANGSVSGGSNSPSAVNRVYEQTSSNPSLGASEVAQVEISSSPIPYVRASSLYDYRNGGQGANAGTYPETVYNQTSAGAGINYGFTITGTANTLVPVTISSPFQITGYAYSNAASTYVPDINRSTVTLTVDGLRVYASVSLNEYGIGRSGEPQFRENIDTGPENPTSTSSVFVYTPSTAYGLNGYTYSLTGTITTTVLYEIDSLGNNAFGDVGISANSSSFINSMLGGIAYSEAFIDPYISIDAGYLGANPNARITLGAGVGNTPAVTSTVPVPAAAWLFASALMGFVSLSRRRAV